MKDKPKFPLIIQSVVITGQNVKVGAVYYLVTFVDADGDLWTTQNGHLSYDLQPLAITSEDERANRIKEEAVKEIENLFGCLAIAILRMEVKSMLFVPATGNNQADYACVRNQAERAANVIESRYIWFGANAALHEDVRLSALKKLLTVPRGES